MQSHCLFPVVQIASLTEVVSVLPAHRQWHTHHLHISSETLQGLDVRELSYEKPSHITKLDAEVYFNKGASVLADSTEFSLSVHALKNNENLEKKSIGMSKNSLHVDSSLITWEKVESQLVIPPGTEFLVVALSARQEGTGALLPTGNGYYADHLKINLMTDDGSVIGPL